MTGTTAVLALTRLVWLRWFTMLGYSLSFVVVPALVFDRTRSAALAGAALLVEGAVRALLAVLAGPVYSRLGPRGALLVAEILRTAGLVLLSLSLVKFWIPVVVVASLLYQFGFSLLQLKQELRCAQLGDQASRCQFQFRLAELGVVPFVLLVAVAGSWAGASYGLLLTAAFVATLAQLTLAWRWLPSGGAQLAVEPLRLGQAAYYLIASRKMVASIGATVLGFAFFAWALAATPFVVQGRELFGLALESPSGSALFKCVAALVGMVVTLSLPRLGGPTALGRLTAVGAMCIPSLFLAGLHVASAALAVFLISLGCALHMCLVSWQRAWRQQLVPLEHRRGFTTLYLGLEVLGVSVAGIILLSGNPTIVCALATLLFVALLAPFLAQPLGVGIATTPGRRPLFLQKKLLPSVGKRN